MSTGTSAIEPSHKQAFFSLPITISGQKAGVMAIIFIVMFIINAAVLMSLPATTGWQNTLIILYGWTMLGCGLAAGIFGLIAILREQERSWVAWLCVLPGAFVLFLLLGEFLFPH